MKNTRRNGITMFPENTDGGMKILKNGKSAELETPKQAAPDQATPKSEKLSLSTKLAFGFGDVYGGGAIQIVNFFYLIFLTDYIGLRPAYAGFIFLIARGWDAISDPLMGVITDRTRTRFGRRRPYFLAATVLVFVSFVLLWLPVDFSAEWMKFLYAMFAYVFYCTVITMTLVPYWGLGGELTMNYNERTSLMLYRMVFSLSTAVAAAVLPMMIVKAFPDPRIGYLVMAASFGLFFSLPWPIIFFKCKERPELQKPPEPWSFRKLFIDPLKIRTTRMLIGLYVAAYVAVDLLSVIFVYFMSYYLGRSDANLVLGTALIVQVFTMPLYALLAKKLGKKSSYLISMVIWSAFMVFIWFITPDLPSWVMYVVAAGIGCGMAGAVFIPWAMFPDVADVGEFVIGERRDGTFSSYMTFARKATAALATMLVSVALDISGYVKPLVVTTDGVIQRINQAQPEGVITTIRVMLSFSPLIFLGLGIYLVLRYPVSEKVQEKLRGYLSYMRGETKTANLDPQEIQDLHRQLVGSKISK